MSSTVFIIRAQRDRIKMNIRYRNLREAGEKMQRRRESAIRIAILLISLISIIFIVLGVILIRQSSPEDISGARYVMSRGCSYEVYE
jgi:cell division septal protein FtsQ